MLQRETFWREFRLLFIEADTTFVKTNSHGYQKNSKRNTRVTQRNRWQPFVLERNWLVPRNQNNINDTLNISVIYCTFPRNWCVFCIEFPCFLRVALRFFFQRLLFFRSQVVQKRKSTVCIANGTIFFSSIFLQNDVSLRSLLSKGK